MSEAAVPSETAMPEDKVLRFRNGIPGFPDSRRFILTEIAEDSAFQILQSIDEPEVSMVVGVPWSFFPDYAPELGEHERHELELSNPEDAVVFCPVTLDASEDVAYLNLLGPFVVNARTREGRQVVLADETQPLRAPVRLP